MCGVVFLFSSRYLQPTGVTGAKAAAAVVARNLIDLTTGCSLGDLASLEALLCALMQADKIPSAAIAVLWDVFAERVPGATPAQSLGALVVIGLLARGRPQLVCDHVGELVAFGLRQEQQSATTTAALDFLRVRYTCLALLHLPASVAATGAGSSKTMCGRLFKV
jgi:hypothetical protein